MRLSMVIMSCWLAKEFCFTPDYGQRTILLVLAPPEPQLVGSWTHISVGTRVDGVGCAHLV